LRLQLLVADTQPACKDEELEPTTVLHRQALTARPVLKANLLEVVVRGPRVASVISPEAEAKARCLPPPPANLPAP
jgi:hypothetical protein